MPDLESELVQINDLPNFVTEIHLHVLIGKDVDRAVLDHNTNDRLLIQSLINDLQLSDVIFVSLTVEGICHVNEDAHGTCCEIAFSHHVLGCPL